MRAKSVSPLPGPHGLYTVSHLPRFLLDSARVGWAGAYFADIMGVPSGSVDHGHERYCIQRNMHREQRRPFGRGPWQDFSIGFSVWHPGEEQQFHWQNGGRSQFLFISPEQLSALHGDKRPPTGLGHRAPLRSRVLELIFDTLQADLAQGSPAGPLVGESLIAGLTAQLLRPSASHTSRLSCAARDRAIELIECRFAEPITLQELADAAGMGVRQISRAFQQATGKSPHQFLLQRRTEHAKVLIDQGLPLVEVALQCGFSDQSQMTRTFVRHVGTTPGRFRAELAARDPAASARRPS